MSTMLAMRERNFCSKKIYSTDSIDNMVMHAYNHTKEHKSEV